MKTSDLAERLNGLEVPWSSLDNELGVSMFLNLIIGVSVGLTEIAVGWLIGLHLEEQKKRENVDCYFLLSSM